MLERTIRMPIWGAGTDKMYGWQKDGLGKLGIGLPKQLLKSVSFIRVKVLTGSVAEIEVDTAEALNYALKYNAFQTVKGGLELAIFPVFPFAFTRRGD
jgi:hypothetical protein